MGELQMCVYVMLGIKSWASHMLGNHFTKGASSASADPSAFLFKFYLPAWFALSFLQRNHIYDLLWERSRLPIPPHDQCLFWVCNIELETHTSPFEPSLFPPPTCIPSPFGIILSVTINGENKHPIVPSSIWKRQPTLAAFVLLHVTGMVVCFQISRYIKTNSKNLVYVELLSTIYSLSRPPLFLLSFPMTKHGISPRVTAL